MKRVIVLLTFVCILLLQMQTTRAQNNYVDIAVVKHITQPFIDAIAEKNIEVRVTYQPGTHYRKDWGEGTFMRLTGTCFAWTDQQGMAWLDCFTMNPPMSLEGKRPPMTLDTAPIDTDGNIVVGDPEYWIRYRIWQTRPVVRFSVDDLFAHNSGLANAWNYWVKGRSDMRKYRDQWEELGFDEDGRVPGYYLKINYTEPVEYNGVPLTAPDWRKAPTYLQPCEEVVDYEVTDVEWKEVKSAIKLVDVLPLVILFTIIIVAYRLLLIKEREQVV